jgi:recombinational DNA repair ATPase RecF
MSELDASRREMLVDRVTRAGQTVITTTDLAHVPLEGVSDALTVSVEGARIVEREPAR